MTETQTSPIKYIYMDVVGFTYNRPVEAQTDIISTLNKTVKQAVSNQIPDQQIIYIPVGDGICISIIGNTPNFDDHIIIAQDIIRRIVSIHNPTVKPSRKFEVRIGINENIDNIITDINGRINVCGSGVNDSQRIMSFGDSSHILVGRTTFDSLRPREKYLKAFRTYVATTKHNTKIELFQYIGGIVSALNRETPSYFTAPSEVKLTKYAAYYLAHLIKNRHFIEKNTKKSYHLYSVAVLFAYLAEDSVGQSTSTKLNPYDNHMPETTNHSLEEQFQLFNELPYWVYENLYELKVESPIKDRYSNCFEPEMCCLVVSENGVKRLQSEWSAIYQEVNA